MGIAAILKAGTVDEEGRDCCKRIGNTERNLMIDEIVHTACILVDNGQETSRTCSMRLDIKLSSPASTTRGSAREIHRGKRNKHE